MGLGDHPPVGATTWRLLALLLVPLLGASLIGLVVLWPRGDADVELRAEGTPLDATVIAVRQVPCPDTAPEAGVRCVRTEVRLTEGRDRGRAVMLDDRPPGGSTLARGDRVVVTRSNDAAATTRYQLTGRQRDAPLAVLAAAAGVALLVLGRWRGARTVLALGVVAVVLAVFAVPAVLDGRAPVGVAVVAAAVTATILLVVGHGPSARSATALVGALLAIAAAGLVGNLAVETAHLAGLTDQAPSFLRVGSGSLPVQGLLLAGIVVGASGAVVDLAVRQVDATWDLSAADVSARFRGIVAGGLRPGASHLADVASALVVAYAGVALPVIVLLSAGDRGVLEVLSGEVMAVELARAFVGALALAATVPLTAAMAALVVVREATPRRGADPRHFRSHRERIVWQDDEP